MKMNTALILCAGYGKRLNPLTLNKPKPLLEVKDISLLENTINLINDFGIKNILNFIFKVKTLHFSNYFNILFAPYCIRIKYKKIFIV